MLVRILSSAKDGLQTFRRWFGSFFGSLFAYHFLYWVKPFFERNFVLQTGRPNSLSCEHGCLKKGQSGATSEKFWGFWNKFLRNCPKMRCVWWFPHKGNFWQVRGLTSVFSPKNPPTNFSEGPPWHRPAVATQPLLFFSENFLGNC